jgi:hypothetical protein
MTSENNIPLEHQNVPEAHQGLHGFLYSTDDEHDSVTPTATVENDGSEIVAIADWRSRTQVKVAGVYAVLDGDRQTQYVGFSRDVRQSLDGHIAQNGDQVCAFIRVQTFKFPNRQAMEALRDDWIAADNPPGNQGALGTWASTIGEAARATMSESERNAYEEKKLKLRKAMADTTLMDEIEKGEDATQVERRLKMEAAVENDDWSAVIER